jgi:hypothetical protein
LHGAVGTVSSLRRNLQYQANRLAGGAVSRPRSQSRVMEILRRA